MDEADEVESYSTAAAAKHLDDIDNTLVAHFLRLLYPRAANTAGSQGATIEAVTVRRVNQAAYQANDAAKPGPEPRFPTQRAVLGGWQARRSLYPEERVPGQQELGTPAEVPAHSDNQGLRELSKERAVLPGWGLDIGTGPAEIPIKLLRKIPDLRMVAIDRSRNMLVRARQNALREAVSDRLVLVIADGHLLPFPDGIFTMVLCNSVLHHAREPIHLLREMVRVAAMEAPLLLRDLRRPSRLFLRWHLWRHGRHYQGLMRKLFEDSVRAAYTLEELEKLVCEAKLEGLSLFRFRGAHLGIERARPLGRGVLGAESQSPTGKPLGAIRTPKG